MPALIYAPARLWHLKSNEVAKNAPHTSLQ